MNARLGETQKVLVVGAGVGGLAASALLARRGYRVVVLERAAAPGGKMRAVETAAGPADAGPTVLTMKDVFEDLFRAAGARLSDRVTLVEEKVLARHFWADGGRLDLSRDPEVSAAAVRAFAGTEAEAAFRAFSDRARRLFEAFDAPVMRAGAPEIGALVARLARAPGLLAAMAPGRSLAAELERRFADPRLAQLFARYATYVGASPFRAPALLALIWHAEASGVWRVAGGMGRLAAAMADLAQDAGARFEFGAEVKRLVFERGRVAGLETAEGLRLGAASVLFNGDPAALRGGLLGDEARRAVGDAQVTPRSFSAWVWSFAAELEGPPLAHHNVFFGADPRAEFDALAKGRPPDDPTIYLCAQDRGEGLTPPRLERFEIIVNGAPVIGRETRDEGEDTRCRELVFGTLKRFGLKFSPPPDPAALTGPSGFAALFPGSGGSLYGLSPRSMTSAFARPRARSRMPGLYLCGGGAHPGAGVPMAALSGMRAAEAISTDLALT
mgnify:CR=1 FL=1